MKVRLQKFLAEAGVASRRAAEQLILEGRVLVNRRVVETLGTRVDPGTDEVMVDGKAVRIRRKIYVALHKPPGYLATRSDPQGRRTVYDLLPAEWAHLVTVGRLDRESEGLIFLTNDGDLSLRLTHPRYGITKIYRVTVAGRVPVEVLDKLIRGVLDKGERLRAHKARLLKTSNSRSLVEVEMKEGKYREIRRLFSVLGLDVEQLQRIQIGRIKLGELPSGKWRVLSETEVNSLKQ